MQPNWKPSATARKLAKNKDRRELVKHERDEKAKVRKRDLYRCRFPLCGCRDAKLRLEVSHQQHKGAGGDPTGDRSLAAGMILLCVHRHQDGAVSIHKGTLRVKPRTPHGTNGPCSFFIDASVDDSTGDRTPRWVEVARESKVQKIEPLTIKQHTLLLGLARLEL